MGALGGQPPRATLPLLWLMAVVAAFLGGMALQERLSKPTIKYNQATGMLDEMELSDGSRWFRYPDE